VPTFDLSRFCSSRAVRVRFEICSAWRRRPIIIATRWYVFNWRTNCWLTADWNVYAHAQYHTISHTAYDKCINAETLGMTRVLIGRGGAVVMQHPAVQWRNQFWRPGTEATKCAPSPAPPTSSCDLISVCIGADSRKILRELVHFKCRTRDDRGAVDAEGEVCGRSLFGGTSSR